VSTEITSVSVPPRLLEPGTGYELELLAIGEGESQVISLLFFERGE
jgi:hypothetical protein